MLSNNDSLTIYLSKMQSSSENIKVLVQNKYMHTKHVLNCVMKGFMKNKSEMKYWLDKLKYYYFYKEIINSYNDIWRNNNAWNSKLA